MRLLRLTLLWVCGCATGQRAQWIAARAAYDLDCPADAIRVERINRDLVGVSGCGERGVYAVGWSDAYPLAVTQHQAPRAPSYAQLDPSPGCESPQLRACAAALLSCRPDRVREEDVGHGQWRVSGCGRSTDLVPAGDGWAQP